ncbi:MAG: hypothetical protein JW388_1462 [Nitrospira sp.]|nr:hypothetical protein [Nitrospira sp.]
MSDLLAVVLGGQCATVSPGILISALRQYWDTLEK